MLNIYTEAFKNISCLQELTIDDFCLGALSSAKVVTEKGAKLYQLLGTKYVIMTHSDQFSTTKNKITWYVLTLLNYKFLSEDSTETDSDQRIGIIKLVDGDIECLIPNEMYEEIMFYVRALRKDKSKL
jgi:hypothetical protein